VSVLECDVVYCRYFGVTVCKPHGNVRIFPCHLGILELRATHKIGRHFLITGL